MTAYGKFVCLLLCFWRGLTHSIALEPLNQSAQDDPHSIPKTSSSPIIDGRLDEAAWNGAWTMDLEYEVQPGENITPPVETQVLITYDSENVYFAFRALDPEPEKIRAHLSDRDCVGADDWVCMILDTFNDERRSFGFLVNPRGVQQDFIETENGGGGSSWDTIWNSAGQITEWGWIVEMKVPFSSLRFQRQKGPQIWGIDAIRSYPRSQRHHIGLFPRDRNNNCYLCQAIKIRGFEDVDPGKNLEVAPTLTAGGTQAREEMPNDPMKTRDDDVEVGITARWGITPNLILSGTVNPDFSQVEADAQQLDINSPFALSYEEKRPFFMEGKDFFESAMDVIYTRTIRDPSWGIKLSGKEGNHTIGAYVVQDEQTNLILPGNQRSDFTTRAFQSTASVVRYKRDIGNKFTLGGLFSDRRGSDYANSVFGLDADMRFTDKDEVRLQALTSRTEYPTDVAEAFHQSTQAMDDQAVNISYTHDTRTWETWACYRDVGADFRADMGFMPRVDYQQAKFGIGYTWNPEQVTWYTNMFAYVETITEEDHNGQPLNDTTVASFTYEGPLQSHSVIEVIQKEEAYEELIFDQNSLFLHTCMKPNGKSHVYCNITTGDQIDYTNTQLGRRINVSPGFTYRFGIHLKIDFSHTYERMKVSGNHLYTAGQSAISASYQFTTRSFFRTLLQYVDYSFNSAMYSDDRDENYEHLFSQLLYSYKINPQTVLFIGYSDNYQANEQYALTQKDRTVFMKVGKAWMY